MRNSLVLALSLLACSAWAQTFTQTDTTTLTFDLGSFQSKTSQFDFVFNQYDPALYAIDSASLTLTFDYSMLGIGFDHKSVPLGGTVTVGLDNTLFTPPMTSSTTDHETLLATFSANANGTASYFFPTHHGAAPILTFMPSELASLSGVGTVNAHLTAVANSTLTIDSSQFAVSAIDASSTVTDKVTATLTVHATPVPEPASIAAVGVGIFGLTRRSRRSR